MTTPLATHWQAPETSSQHTTVLTAPPTASFAAEIASKPAAQKYAQTAAQLRADRAPTATKTAPPTAPKTAQAKPALPVQFSYITAGQLRSSAKTAPPPPSPRLCRRPRILVGRLRRSSHAEEGARVSGLMTRADPLPWAIMIVPVVHQEKNIRACPLWVAASVKFAPGKTWDLPGVPPAATKDRRFQFPAHCACFSSFTSILKIQVYSS